ncbi:hypothetical protein [Saccharopolyspora spinosa]|uniref:Uncharacterized protein n=1 Tax=Saccharopolyspora spinosa TaxID=60894 RepID=A0A2N3XSK7_SACSN|nr:hypothetical protein [Saccharopolyspora spinosa]PKW13676.1 hypothetical protein A8926_1224 [Saccharopolyspora spinosa]
MTEYVSNAGRLVAEDVHRHIEELKADGVRVAFSDRLPEPAFATLRQDGKVLTATGTINMDTAGDLTVVLWDGNEHIDRAMLKVAKKALGGRAWSCGSGDCDRCWTNPDGSTTYLLRGWLGLTRAAEFLELHILREQLDRPDSCRRCGRGVRTYKPFEGGWVCRKCATDPTELEGVAAQRVWSCRELGARHMLDALRAEETGAYAEATQSWELAEHFGSEKDMAFCIELAGGIADRRQRQAVLRARRAAKHARVNGGAA